jgi:hypothetical protein
MSEKYTFPSPSTAGPSVKVYLPSIFWTGPVGRTPGIPAGE